MYDTNSRAQKVRENAARRWAKRHGLILRKSRAQRLSLDNLGGYMLVDDERNLAVAGERYNLDLDDVETILREYDEELSQVAVRPV